MKYQDILPDVLAGKLVSPTKGGTWIRMNDNGEWEYENGNRHGYGPLKKKYYSQDTWEVKPSEPEEIYVWGVCHESGKSEIYSKEPYPGSPRDWVSDHVNEWLEFGDKKNLFPKDKPQKYKLIPVDDEEPVETTRTSFQNIAKRVYPNINTNDEKEESTSAEKYANTSYGGSPIKEVMRLKRVWEIEAFKAGEASKELKHQETETFDEFIKKDSVIKPDTPNYVGHEYTWNRALKSRGYE